MEYTQSRTVKLLPIVIAFFSGFAALIYQVVWIRDFSLLFGTHLLSTSTILSVFMAGLAAGAWIAGKLADKLRQPLILLVILQAGTAGFAMAFPLVFDLIRDAYGHLNSSDTIFAENPDLSRLLLTFAALIVPASFMGGNIPVLARLNTFRVDSIGKGVGSIYSLNNAGAFAGCFLAGFFLIRLMGSGSSNQLAAALNITNVLIALFMLAGSVQQKVESLKNKEESRDQNQDKLSLVVRVVLLVSLVEGFTMMVYEVLWTRLLTEFSYDKSPYVYTTVILGFLGGLSSGAWFARKRIDRWKNPVYRFGQVELLVGLVSFLSLILFSYLSPSLFSKRLTDASWMAVSGKDYVICFLFTFPAAFLMGISFPLGSKIITRNLGSLGSRTGILGFTDTAGSILGPLVTGFILLKYLNVYYVFLLGVALNILSASLLFGIEKETSRKEKQRFSFAGILILGVMLMILPPSAYNKNKLKLYPGDQILALKEGRTATAAVHNLSSGYLALSVNGAKTAFTNPEDLLVHKMLAYMPWLYKTDSQNAAVIGFGLGVTARCLADLDIQTDLAEISPEVLRLSSVYFHFVNHGVLASGKLRIFQEDGRSVIQKKQGSYDIITTNAVHPRLGPMLYSKEFYELCASRLSEKGVMCQWIPTNWMSRSEFGSLIRAFTPAFTHVALWYVNRAHLVILGSSGELKPDPDQFIQSFSEKNIYYEFADVDIYETEALLANYLMDRQRLDSLYSSSVPDTDDKPVIEYSFVTDPRPNLQVLSDIQNNRMSPGLYLNFNDINDSTRFIDLRDKILRYRMEQDLYLDMLIMQLKDTSKPE